VKYRHREFTTRSKCGGKNCYNSRQEAEIVAHEQELLDVSGETKIAVYQCQFCGKWHLTSRASKDSSTTMN
jgi:hypothetical protein